MTIAIWPCKVEDLFGEEVVFHFDIIMGRSPLLLGLDYDRHADTSSLESPPTWRVRVGEKTHTFGIYIARDETGNYRRFVQFRVEPRTFLSVMSRARRNQGVVKMAHENPRRYAMKLHGWTHLGLEPMRKLSRQADVLTPEVDEQLRRVVERCDVCPLTGSNVGSPGFRRVSLTKFVHPEANRMLELDHVSHVVSTSPRVREVVCLSMACNSSGYGETPPVSSKGLEDAIEAIEHSWVLRHGAPEAIAADPGLGGRVMQQFCGKHSIRWDPRPPRRHNTIGVVERRNGVMRMILERIVVANDALESSKRSSDELLIERANFLANVMLGDATLSSFQLLKGYQPSLVGLPASELSAENVEAHLQVRTSRALSRLLRSKSFTPYVKPPLKVGQKIYIHTQRFTGSRRGAVGWAAHTVCRIDDSMVATRPVGRTSGRMNLTSFADVRVPPENALAQQAFEFALNQPSSQVGRCGGDATSTVDVEPSVGDGEVSADIADDHGGDEDRGIDDVTEDFENHTSADLTPAPATEKDAGAPASLFADVCAFYSRIEDCALTRDATETGDTEKDIGQLSITEPSIDEPELQRSDVQTICESILECVGREAVTRAKLNFVPPWLLDEALQNELEGWDEHISVEPYAAIPSTGKSLRKRIIGSHVLYCVKTRESGEHYVKARLVLHGNEEADKESLRSDASALYFTLIRVILSLSVCLGFRIGGADVSKAYHQSGGPPREIRVRPPPECMLYRAVWLLLSLPYGLVDAGRQWQLAMESWLLDDLSFVTFGGLPQVFAKLDAQGAIILLIGKVSDDILVAGKENDIAEFFEVLNDRWEIGKSIIADNLLFNGARILRDQDSGEIELSMEEYLHERVELLPLPRDRRKQQEARATPTEIAAYRSLAGTLNFLGTGALPEASFVASVFLQRQANLLVHDIDMGNRLVAELKKMKPAVKFASPPASVDRVTLVGFSDASFNVISGSCYGQSGYFCGLLFASASSFVYHVVDWFSCKQRRVVYSSFGAEILGCADSDNRLYGLKMGLRELLNEPILSELLVDSKGLFTCVTTLSDQREYRLRRTIARIRESFDSEELNSLRWISGQLNLAGAMTKWNPASWKLLQQVLNSGMLPADVVRGQVRGDKPDWRRNLPLALRHDSS